VATSGIDLFINSHIVAIGYVFVFAFGISLGSFLNVVIYRLPKNLSLVRPGSSCPACQARIRWYDNIPLVSYLLLRGRCRQCSASISPRYFTVELIAGLLCVAIYHHYGLTPRMPFLIYFSLSLVALTYIDLDEMIIPDKITYPAIVIGLLASILAPSMTLTGPRLGLTLMHLGLDSLRLVSLAGSVLGLFVGGGIVWLIYNLYYLVRKEEGIGGGDFTLLSMIGAFLGYRAVLISLFFGSMIALAVVVVIGIKDRDFDLKMKLPFGPFLSLAALIYVFFGEAFLLWYLS